ENRTENASTGKQLTEAQPAKYETENRLEPSESLRSQESFMPAPSRGERNPFPRGTRCPPGEFARLAQRLRQRRQRRFFLRAAVAAAAVVATGGGLSLWLGGRATGEPTPGGRTCAKGEKLAPPSARGELSATVRAQVRQHIAQCPRCGPRFRAMGLPT